MHFKLHAVHSKASPHIMLNLDIEGRNVRIEVDTGAAFSVISELMYRTKFADLPLVSPKSHYNTIQVSVFPSLAS